MLANKINLFFVYAIVSIEGNLETSHMKKRKIIFEHARGEHILLRGVES